MTWFFRKSPQLSTNEIRRLMERAAAVSDASLPLPSGLRAAASEASSRRLHRAMLHMADRLDEGASWPQLLSEQSLDCPVDLLGTLQAAMECGHTDEVLSHYVRLRATRRDLALSIRGVLAYPLMLLLFAFILLVAISTSVLPEIDSLFGDWGLRMGGPNQVTRWWASSGVWWLLKGAPVAIAAVLILRWAVGPARWRSVLYHIPLVGRLSLWLGVMEWTRMLSQYVGLNIPLPQAIRWASAGSPDASIRQCGGELAHGIEEGNTLSEMVERQRCWPAILTTLLQTGETAQNLTGALTTAADYFEERLQIRLSLLRAVTPPILFGLVATGIVLVFGALLLLTYLAVAPFIWFKLPSNLDNAIAFPENLLGPLSFGVVLIWTVAVAHRHRTDQRQESLLQLLELIGWLLLVGSLTGCFFSVFGALTWICFPICAVVALVFTQRCRDAEKQALVHTLTMAAEQGIPLAAATRAFAHERTLARNHRICDLADLLDAGLPLPEALQQAKLRLPSATALAVQVSRGSGYLGAAMRESIGITAASRPVLTSLLEQFTYVLLILCVGLPTLYSVLDTTMPIMRQMAGEFGTEQLDAVAAWDRVKELPSEAAKDWIAFLVIALVLGLISSLAVFLMFYVRWLSTDLPLVRRFWLPWERSIVLHALSIATRHQKSIAESLRLLHTHHPKRSIRRRLEKALRITNAGGDWRAGLRKAGFINRREAAVLQAAEQVDNVGWAIREIADRGLQRVACRVQNLLNVTVPLLVLIAGLFVLAIAATQFEMLADIVEVGAQL